MPIDPSVAIGAELGAAEFSWSTSDVLLYQLALGAGADPLAARELRYATEQDTVVLPTFATVAQNFHATEPPKVSFPGVEIDLAKVVHGSQSVTAHRPLPASGTATARTRISDVHDKGKAAVIWQETEVVDGAGEPLWTARSSIFARGEGGFGGERGPSERIELPARDADVTVDVPTLPQQALLYRLCGDRNPLHSDPAFARAAGFYAPILHGLCTYGIVAKSVTDAVLDGDASAVGSWSAKFAGIMLPGETLRVRIWRDGDRHLVTAESVERSAPVLADAVFTAR
ncbi:MaoC/PaaZ C-terminal domain-containing protein [Tsukamurella paurometabola]|uniref:Enoyl reductase domain of yeast-type FAS1 n=1 Tax=Tsukamurella paurometabola TaxID=2061 RepID=A0A3P8L277_TSUPA|nr:MaoC/PaaZ C-terminal domain-containing protein [Tsukamurella paurometabola]UEA81891.1 MaoC family dehydratase N-terminal domain-containing protein [Tsukamurella paurometabola]VDR38915.1 Enoyl reductase domain of yeast-type FAS1 [Tsukamurella paurometabola]